MLISILINVLYLQNVVFSFEKEWSKSQPASDSHHPIKKSPQQNPPTGNFPTP